MEDLVKDIKKDVRRVAREALKEAKRDAENDLYELKEQIINEFYKYNAKNSDERHGNLWNAIKINTTGKGYNYTVEMTVDDILMNGSYGDGSGKNGGRRISNANVLDLIWNQGIRGLPEEGTRPLKESYDYLGNHFEAGEPWKNPYWDQEKYQNEFRVQVRIGKFTSAYDKPDKVAEEFIKSWGDYRYDDVIEKAIEKVTKQ